MEGVCEGPVWIGNRKLEVFILPTFIKKNTCWPSSAKFSSQEVELLKNSTEAGKGGNRLVVIILFGQACILLWPFGAVISERKENGSIRNKS